MSVRRYEGRGNVARKALQRAFTIEVRETTQQQSASRRSQTCPRIPRTALWKERTPDCCLWKRADESSGKVGCFHVSTCNDSLRNCGAGIERKGATYSQVDYLARAYSGTGIERYREACLRGLEFILAAEYANGGWPQFFPDTSGYRRYITFNDGAMIGVMKILQHIIRNDPAYAFVDSALRSRIRASFEKGVESILRCQIVEHGQKLVWCQQHDHVTFTPRRARSFELASLANQESAEIVLFLMSLDDPDERIIEAVESAVRWFESSRILGVRVASIGAQRTKFFSHISSEDRVVVTDSTAPPIWPRFSELTTHRPLFSNRNGRPAYSLAEVDRERRTD